MRDIIRLSLRLLLFCLVAALLLAATNEITREPIARQAEITAQNARKQALTEAASFRQILDGALPEYPHLTAVYEGVDSSGVVGYTFSLAPMGFKATIEMTLGVNKDGAITVLSVESQQETAGLGNKITTDAYLSQYQGVAASRTALDQEIDGITGATVTSRAVINAVNEAVEYAEKELGIVGKADAGLAGSRLLSEEELQLVSLVDGGRTISALTPYQAMGYDAIEAVYQVSVRGNVAYVITIRADGEQYEVSIDEKGRQSVYRGENLMEEVPTIDPLTGDENSLDRAVRQAMDFYRDHLSEEGGQDHE